MPKRSQRGAGPRRLRQRVLPGTAGVRSVKLDGWCQTIGDARGTMNEARTQAQTAISAALTEMQAKGIRTYKHDGVELSRVPGGEKLRVRVTHDEADATDADLAPAPATTETEA